MKLLIWSAVLATSCITPTDTPVSEGDFAYIRGVNFVAPRQFIGASSLESIVDLQANYIAIVPYAFTPRNQPVVNFDTSRQWWGERKQGVLVTIGYAQNMGLNVMLKPHVWVFEQGWPGDFDLKTEAEWLQWEQQYREYILTFAELAESQNVEVYCIGTEFRIAVRERPEFWIKLIKDVRNIYRGKITYAANWDSYENITFWDHLDFIGIDAYFPLVKAARPDYHQLRDAWMGRAASLQRFYEKWKKPIVFTEFGYQSMDHATDSHWEHHPDSLTVNVSLQDEAYRAMFETIWYQPWFAGGFLWKWHADHQNAGGTNHKSWTPQNKPAQATIKRYYSK